MQPLENMYFWYIILNIYFFDFIFFIFALHFLYKSAEFYLFLLWFQMHRLLHTAGGSAVLPPHPGIHGNTFRRFFAFRGALSPSKPPFSTSFRPAGGSDDANFVSPPSNEQSIANRQDTHARPPTQKRRQS